MQQTYDFDATIANFTETIRRNPKDVVTLVGRGSSYAIEGYYQKALAEFNEALRIEPKDSHAYRGGLQAPVAPIWFSGFHSLQ